MARKRPAEPDSDDDTHSDTSTAKTRVAPRFARSGTVTVYVGVEKARYLVHEDILTSTCPFFEKCLQSGMREQHERTVELPEDAPETFDVIVKWMYSGQVPALLGPHIMRAYKLAEKLCMLDLQNALVDAFKAVCRRERISPITVMLTWKHLPENSELCKLALKQLCYEIVKEPRNYMGTSSSFFGATQTGTLEGELKEMLEEGGPLVSAFFSQYVDERKRPRSRLSDPSY